MQIDVPRYVWSDTRFRRDAADPLTFHALTKSYDPETHQVAPFGFDVDFKLTGVTPQIARSVIALSELGMLSLPNLVSTVDAGEQRAGNSPLKPRFKVFSNYFSELTGTRKGVFRPTGHLFGMLSGGFLAEVYEKNLNLYDVLDADCRYPEAGITDRFVGFYLGLRRTSVVRAQAMVDQPAPEGIPLESWIGLVLSDQDKGFQTALQRLDRFVQVYDNPKNPKKVSSVHELPPAALTKLFGLYCSEISVGVNFLKEREVETGHDKILTHTHTQLEHVKGTQCIVATGDSDVRREIVETHAADIEFAFRCPFFVEQGWVDTRVRSTLNAG